MNSVLLNTDIIKSLLDTGNEVFLIEDTSGKLALYSSRSISVDEYRAATCPPDTDISVSALLDHYMKSPEVRLKAATHHLPMFVRYKAAKIYVFTQNAWHKYRTLGNEPGTEERPPELEAYLKARNTDLNELVIAEMMTRDDGRSQVPLALIHKESGFRVSLQMDDLK